MNTKKYFLTTLSLILALSIIAQEDTCNYILFDELEDEELYQSSVKSDLTVLPTLNNVFEDKIISSKSTSSLVTLVTPPIGNQGSLGSCAAWAVSYAAGGILAYSKFGNWDTAKRSPSYLFNQYKILQSSGSYASNPYTLASHQQTEGVCSLAMMPYDPNDCTTQPNSTQHFDAYLNRTTFYTIATSSLSSVSGYKAILNSGYPIIVTIEMTDAFRSMWNNGNGLWTNIGNGEGKYHAVCIVGYNDNTQMFKVQNS